MTPPREPEDGTTQDAADRDDVAAAALDDALRASAAMTGDAVDARAVAVDIEASILGSPRVLNRVQVTEAAGVDLERAEQLWRALGFPSPADDDHVLFNEGDIEALRLAQWLEEAASIKPEVELTLVRTLGRGFARLAEWEVAEIAGALLPAEVLGAVEPDEEPAEESDEESDEGADEAAMLAPESILDGVTPEATEEMKALVSSIMPVLEDLQNYVWRRHLAQAAGRLLLHPRDGEGATTVAVGFADIVGFTRRSRDISAVELGALVDLFEGHSFDVVTRHGGRVIKTIGDEILFVADTAEDGARIALDLLDAEDLVEGFPTLRVGLAHGPVLSRVGDVFGPVVNTAARLTSLSRPGRSLVDREMRDRLREHPEEFRVRRSRTTSVRGYSRFDTWALRRPKSGSRKRDLATSHEGGGLDPVGQVAHEAEVGRVLR